MTGRHCWQKLAVFGLMAIMYSASTDLNGAEFSVVPDGSGDFTDIQTAIDAVVEGDVIIVTAGVYTLSHSLELKGKTITLQSTDPMDPCVVADTIIDAAGACSAFLINQGEDPCCSIDGLTITHGNGSFGGAVVCYNDSGLTIRRCVIQNNTSSGAGGAIWCGNGSGIILEDTMVRDNQAGTDGGAMYVYNTPITIKNCIIEGNQTGRYGAGLCASLCKKVEIFGSQFSYNAGATTGGGMYCLESKLTLTYSRFLGNEGAIGGGIYIKNTPATFSHALMNGNISDKGGAIYCENMQDMTVNHSVFVGNYAGYSGTFEPGGAIHCTTSSKPKIRNSIFWQNRPQQIAALSTSVPTIQYCLVQGGWGSTEDHNIAADPCDPRKPGPRFLLEGQWQNDTWIEADFENYEHLAYRLRTASPVSICVDAGDPNFVPEQDETDVDGDFRFNGFGLDIGIDETHPDYRVYNCEKQKWYPQNQPDMPISEALAEAGAGDEIVINPGKYRENLFIDQSITLRSQKPDVQAFLDGTIIENSLSETANSLIVIESAGAPLLSGLTLQAAENSIGNGIFCRDSDPAINRCVIRGHTATMGAGMECWNSNPLITKTIFENNEAAIDGGALALLDGSHAVLRNCVIDDNKAGGSGGGVYCDNNSWCTVDFCTIKDNHSYAFFKTGPQRIAINNSILWNNHPEDQIEQIAASDPCSFVLHYCNVQNGWGGFGANNIDHNPVFSGYTDEGDPDDPNDNVWVEWPYPLSASSPCINAGDPDYETGDTEEDIAGGNRLAFCRVDIGAWEAGNVSTSGLPGVVNNITQNTWHCRIQEAINAAKKKDQIVVSRGIYYENIRIATREIILKSYRPTDAEYISETVIDGSRIDPCNLDYRSVITLMPQIAAQVSIEGLTLQNGMGFTDPCGLGAGTGNELKIGGGVFAAYNDDLTIKNCRILNNTAEAGGGILLHECVRPSIEHCIVSENSAYGVNGTGGGIYLLDCRDIELNNSIISRNIADAISGGVYLVNVENIESEFCTIADNQSFVGGGMVIIRDNDIDISNSIMWNNQPDEITILDPCGVAIESPEKVSFTYCNLSGGWGDDEDHNLNVDPCFVNAAELDYHLHQKSPLINAGDPDYLTGAGDVDIDNEKRLQFVYVDIGADEVSEIEAELLTGIVKNIRKDKWYNSIQAAINDAAADDEIILAPGEYRENVTINKTGLILRSLEPENEIYIRKTVIDGGGNDPCLSDSGPAVTLVNGQADRVKIKGLTLTHGTGKLFNNQTPSDPCDDYTQGGGLYSLNNDQNQISYCRIIDNAADYGAGVFLSHANLGSFTKTSTIDHCSFLGNSYRATGNDGYGGGLAVNNSNNVNIYYNIFARNASLKEGGGIGLREAFNVNVDFCTTADNIAGSGGGIGVWKNNQDITINSCIVWGNTPEQLFDDNTTNLNVRYSDIQGGYAGEHVMSADPCFVDANNDDYHLKSTVGRWNPAAQSWFVDGSHSPCIDAGDPCEPVGDELWPHAYRANQGGYGRTIEASFSTLSVVGSAADITNDKTVNLSDYLSISEKWLSKSPLMKQDVNRDKTVDMLDLEILIEVWLANYD